MASHCEPSRPLERERDGILTGGKHRAILAEAGDSEEEIGRTTALPPGFSRGGVVALLELGDTRPASLEERSTAEVWSRPRHISRLLDPSVSQSVSSRHTPFGRAYVPPSTAFGTPRVLDASRLSDASRLTQPASPLELFGRAGAERRVRPWQRHGALPH